MLACFCFPPPHTPFEACRSLEPVPFAACYFHRAAAKINQSQQAVTTNNKHQQATASNHKRKQATASRHACEGVGPTPRANSPKSLYPWCIAQVSLRPSLSTPGACEGWRTCLYLVHHSQRPSVELRAPVFVVLNSLHSRNVHARC